MPDGTAEALPPGTVAPRTPKLPEPPSDELVAEHRLTHLPYEAWCHTCVEAKGRDDPHWRVVQDDADVPLVELDYTTMTTSHPDDCTVPVL
eukprot:4137450-Heterocapsa_arctica.AAC.1